MTTIDDCVTWPVQGLGWIAREFSHAAGEDRLAETDALRRELRQLNTDLRRGMISVADFSLKETKLLDQLDRLEEVIRAEDFDTQEFAEGLMEEGP